MRQSDIDNLSKLQDIKKQTIVCPVCHTTGKVKCSKCKSKNQKCDLCAGTGFIVCQECWGTGYIYKANN